jgi:pimeloyl-ACP methyl ester carboxylesterase
MRVWIRRIWATAGISFMGWLVWNAAAHGVDDALLQSSPTVQVERHDDYLVMTPASGPSASLVFLPGGGVDPDAYVPIVRRLAEDGIRTAIVYLPWRMAFSESSREVVWQRIDAVANRWHGGPFVLGGHSRGAALSAQYATRGDTRLAGLVLIATTHPRDHDLSAASFPVLKVAGTRDCVAPLDDARANARNLPTTTRWSIIEGANHAQFAYYGRQLGDCTADITRAAQQDALHTALMSWFRDKQLLR